MKSNCLIEALRAVWTTPYVKVYWNKGEWGSSFPHCYWYDIFNGKYWHFSADDKNLPLVRQFWFSGTVKEYHFHGRRENQTAVSREGET
jgi:hypothetical protein